MNSHNPDGFRRTRRVETVALPQVNKAAWPAVPSVMDSQSIFNGNREIGINHNGSLYRLKITRQGKLILNK